MLRLVSAFVDIALHRRGPDSLPASTFLLVLVIAIDLLIVCVSLLLAEATPQLVFGMLALNTVLPILFVWSTLRAFFRPQRLKQTIIALYGVDAFMSTLSLPLLLAARSVEQSGGEPWLPVVLYQIIYVWALDVAGFVLSRAIDRPYFLGLALVIGYWLLATMLRSAIFPPAAA